MTAVPPIRLPKRDTKAHKGRFGRCLLVGGSRGMSGSIALSSIAALRCGSGLVTAAVPDRCLESVAAFHPCVMTLGMPDDGSGRFSLSASKKFSTALKSTTAVGCGPGMTTEPGSHPIVDRLLHQRSTPRVFDADAINSLAVLSWTRINALGPIVLTPHPGELERLTGVSAGNRDGQIIAAKEIATTTGAVVVVKGGPTVVVKAGKIWTNTTGNPGMATAGSGDVLTGIVTSLLGQGLPTWEAACLGVWVHGHAGDLAAKSHGQAGMTALEILEALPSAMRDAVE